MAHKSKQKRSHKKSTPKKSKTSSSWADYFEKHPNILPLTLLFVLLLIFFNQVIFGGKTLLPPDTLASKSVQPFLKDAFRHHIYPLWNPYIFSGMPSFASLSSAPFVDLLGDGINAVIWFFKLIFPLPDFTRILLNYFLFGIFMYILLKRKTGLAFVALFSSVIMLFQPQVVAYPAFGHNTKLLTASLIPLIYLVTEELLETRKILYLGLLGLSIGLQLLRAHVQIAYYTFLMVGLFYLYWAIETILKKKDWKGALLSGVFLAVAVVLGVALSSWLNLSVYEYSHYSIRGGTGGGLSYAYATSWSFSPLEILTFFIPSFVGFGGQTYWGHMPFTDFPLYMGLIPLILVGFAFLLKPGRTTYFAGLLGLLALLASFGKELPVLYEPMFKLLPFFNKFRAPNTILILLQFSVAVLAGVGLVALLKLNLDKLDKSTLKKLQNYLYAFGGFLLLLFLYLLAARSSLLGSIAASGKINNPALQERAYKMAVNDGVKALALFIFAFGLIWLYLKKSIQGGALMWGLFILLIIDLWAVDFKIIHPQPKASEKSFFAATETVHFLKKDTSLYRIMPVLDDKPANWYMYHLIQNMYGYQAAKIKIYQEMLSESGLPRSFFMKYVKPVMQNGRQGMAYRTPQELDLKEWHFHKVLLDMLNVKYILSPYAVPDKIYPIVFKATHKKVLENKSVLPRAFFVDTLEVRHSKKAVFDRMKQLDFDPSKEAILEENPPFVIQASAQNRVTVTRYSIHRIDLSASVAQPALLVLSEVYYPAGWKALVDGQPTKIYKTNYILRSVFLKPGHHTVQFIFQPKSFRVGLAITVVTLLLLLGLIFVGWKQEEKTAL